MMITTRLIWSYLYWFAYWSAQWIPFLEMRSVTGYKQQANCAFSLQTFFFFFNYKSYCTGVWIDEGPSWPLTWCVGLYCTLRTFPVSIYLKYAFVLSHHLNIKWFFYSNLVCFTEGVSFFTERFVLSHITARGVLSFHITLVKRAGFAPQMCSDVTKSCSHVLVLNFDPLEDGGALKKKEGNDNICSCFTR